MLAQIKKDYGDSVRFVYRHFPLSIHDKAIITAQAAEAAGLQDKFWEMHDAIFAAQETWSPMSVEDTEKWLVDQAGKLGLDEDQFRSDLKSQAVVDKVKAASQSASSIGIPFTPFLLINGRTYPDQLPRTYDMITAVIKLILIEDRQFTACPPMVIDPAKQYTATLKTAKGDIVIQLLPDKAPLAVNSFVYLAREGWFNDITFHRVIHDFVAQTGDPTGTGFGNPGYAFATEKNDLKFDREGVVGMANSGQDTNGSQFFITYGPAPDLDGSYTVFGQVIEGMDVAKQLTERNPQVGETLPEGDRLIEVVITEK